MTLQDLGYTIKLEQYRKEHNLDSFGVGRVISEHRDRYVIQTAEQEYDGEIIGNLRFTATQRADFPAVGDWVALSEYDEHKVLIHSIFPRATILERQTVGKQGEKQIIAANIDYALIVQSVDRDFSLNRIERYLTLCNTANVHPVIVLSKIDLVDEVVLTTMIQSIGERSHNVPLLAVSNEVQQGLDQVKELIKQGKTYCLLGSSGVGKSTLLNNLLGKQMMKTETISASSNRGKHVTSYRELHVLESGGILIDNPGMREVGIADSADGLERTFDTIVAFSKKCKFRDCTHTSEKGCAVMAAVESGQIDPLAYENYLKMERERQHFESTVAEKRKKDKDFGKMMKNYKKDNYKKY